jgi:hypothetical protein
MKNKLVLIFLILVVCLACEKKCFDAEPKISVRFFNQLNQDTFPKFDKVYALSGIKDIQFNNNQFIPLSLSQDSTVVVFEKGAQADTIIFRYARKLQEDRKTSYCITLENDTVISTFNNFCCQFKINTGFGAYNCTDNAFELYIYY